MKNKSGPASITNLLNGIDEMKYILEHIDGDVQKVKKGNKAASVRLRKTMIYLDRLSRSVRDNSRMSEEDLKRLKRADKLKSLGI
jgi:hypothetical protein